MSKSGGGTYARRHLPAVASPFGAASAKQTQSQLTILQTAVSRHHDTQHSSPSRVCAPATVREAKRINGQAARLISIGQLHISRCFHIRPIDLVIYQEPSGVLRPGTSHLVEGFTLRCFQRFSLPHVATRRCHWRDNRYTRGASNPVLSY